MTLATLKGYLYKKYPPTSQSRLEHIEQLFGSGRSGRGDISECHDEEFVASVTPR
ncbi:MAG: hypothetical protein ACYDA1_08280 [Vulcanimicrobiaceae bacterium]